MSDAHESRLAQPRPVRARSWQVTLILTLFFIAVAGAAGIGWWYARESPPHQGPIVLITVDGLQANALVATEPRGTAVTDAPISGTPALTALAADAVIFDRAYTHSPLLLPAQASLLSGQLPFEHGVRDEVGFALQPDTLTLPALLRNRGFNTGAAVSSFLLRSATGVGHGFSAYTGPDVNATAAAHDVSSTRRASAASGPDTNDVRAVRDVSGGDAVDAGDADLSAADAAERAIESAAKWAGEQQGQRYFLMLQVNASYAESAVARVVTLLRERRLYDGATIVLVGERGRVDGAIDEDTLRVPLLVKQPQHEGAGRHVAMQVQHIDLLPTVLDLVRAPIPPALRGRSLKPLLTESAGRITPQPIYAESLAAAYRFGGVPTLALTLNDFRYLRSGTEALVRVAGSDVAAPQVETSATASGELPLLHATLDRMIGARALPRARPVMARDRDQLARAGVLAGLQTVAAAPSLSDEQQQAIAAAHRDAARLVGLGRLSAALRLLQQIAKANPELAAVHYQIGSIASELGHTGDAITAWQEAAALRPDSAEVARALATAFLRAGRLAEAEEQIHVALEAAPHVDAAEIAAAHDLAARLALARGNPEEALQHADAVQAADPAIPMRAFVQGQLLAASGDTEEAARLLRSAVAIVRQHDGALEGLNLALAQALATLDQREDAEAAFRAELKDFPHTVPAYTGLAQLLHASDRDEDAATVIAGLLATSPTPDGYAAAARLWTLIGETARAADVRSEARVRFPSEQAQAPRLARAKRR